MSLPLPLLLSLAVQKRALPEREQNSESCPMAFIFIVKKAKKIIIKNHSAWLMNFCLIPAYVFMNLSYSVENYGKDGGQ